MNLGHGMAKTCIICGGAAGSGEHVFPAAFGGRRTNKGIYCGPHNNALGSHVSVLLESFDIMNAIAGVRPDRHDTFRPAKVVGSDGTSYFLGKNHVGLAPPPPLDISTDGNGEMKTLTFESMEQANVWMAEQRKSGFVIQATAGPIQTRFFTEPLHVSKTIGGEPFLRAVAYIALTFLAHHFPEAARAPGVQGIKDVVTGGGPWNNKVWWLRSEDLTALPPTPFPTSHTVAVAVSRETGDATALVSLFGGVSFGVNLGKVHPAETMLVTTHINPLAEKAPKDLDTVKENGVQLSLSTHDEGLEYLKAVASGKATHPFLSHLIQSSNSQLDDTAERVLPALLAAGRLTGFDRSEEISRVMGGERQRVLNLLQGGITRFAEFAPDLPPAVHGLAGVLIAADSSRPSGLSAPAEAALEVTRGVVNAEIERLLSVDGLNHETFKSLLSGGVGVALVFEALVKPLLLGALPR